MSKDYIQRINTAIEFINLNLDQELNLSNISKAALYSPFHFHRLFAAFTGESLSKYVLRLRMERGALQLKKDKNKSIGTIAINNGFESNASFSKAFKKYYGISPSFLKDHTDEFSKIRLINSKNGKPTVHISSDLYSVNNVNHMKPKIPITFKDVKEKKVAYVAYVGAFDKIGDSYKVLMSWAMMNNVPFTNTLTRFHDSPEVTELSQIRQSACIEILKNFASNGKVLFSTIDGGMHAVGSFELELNELDRAWQYMMLWIAERGLVPDEKKTCFEMYMNQLSKTPAEKHRIDIYVPIKNQV